MFSVRLTACAIVLLFARPALSQGSCDDGVSACTNTLLDVFPSLMNNPESLCGAVQTFVSCIFSLDCPLTEAQRQQIIQSATSQISQSGLDCDISGATGGGSGTGTGTGSGTGTGTGTGSGTGTGTGTGTGSGGSSAAAMFGQVVLLFGKHNCLQVPSQCSSNFDPSGSPSCSTVRSSGECMFKNCPDIKGTADETQAANLLAQYAKSEFNCQFDPNDLTGRSGGSAVWGSLSLLLAATALKALLV